MRCCHCSLPITDAEALGGSCPACGRALSSSSPITPGEAPAQPPAVVQPALMRRRLLVAASAAAGLAVGFGAAWFLLAVLARGPADDLSVVRPIPDNKNVVLAPDETNKKAALYPKTSDEDLAAKRELLARTEKALAELKLAAAHAIIEKEQAEKRASEAKLLLDKLAQEKNLIDKRIADAVAAEKTFADARAALFKAQADGFDLRVLDDPARDYALGDLRVAAKVRVIGKARTLTIGNLDGGAILDIAQLVAQEVHFTGSIAGKSRVTLAGAAKVLTVHEVHGGALFDAEGFAPEKALFRKEIYGQAFVKLTGAQVSVDFEGSITGNAKVTVHAPAAAVEFLAAVGSPTQGDARVMVLGRDVHFRGAVHGGPNTHVVVALAKGGALAVHSVGGAARVLWQKADGRDPEPRLNVGTVAAPAEFREVGAALRPQGLSAKVAAAWQAAGAEVGVIQVHGLHAAAPEQRTSLYGFRFHALPNLADLPAPEVPFSLDLSKTQLGDAEIKHLARFKTLQALNIADNQVTNAGLADIADLNGLRWLSLSNNAAVTDDGMVAVACFEDMQVLDLRGTKITDLGLKDLARLKKLQALLLYYTGVSDAGLKDIAAIKGLQVLDLSRTRVTDKGFQELAGLNNLRVLNLVRTWVTDLGLKDLARLGNLQELHLVTRRVSDRGLVDLASLKNLKFLNLQSSQVTDAGIEHLLGHARLEALNLSGAKVTDAGLARLARLPNLKVVDVSGVRLTERGLEHFQTLRKDCQLIVQGNNHPEDQGPLGIVRVLDLDLGTLTLALAPDMREKTFSLGGRDVPVSHPFKKTLLSDLRAHQWTALTVNHFEEVTAIRILMDRAFPPVALPLLLWARHQ